MQQPHISFTGYLGFDPSLRVTATGTSVLDLRVGSTPRKRVGPDQWEDLETMWFDVTCWDKLADNLAQSLHKGDKVTVTGNLVQSSFTKEDGSVSTKLVVGATAVGADLSRSPVLVKRTTRESVGEQVFARVDTRTGEITGEVHDEQVEGSAADADEAGEREDVAA